MIIQHFGSADTMVQALKTGEVDYVRGVLADQFDDLKDDPDMAVVEGIANGYTELSFNTGGNKEGYGGSTSALADIAFRDALGYAIDNEALVEATLGGYGTPGSTIIPPFHTRWHVPPANPAHVRHRGGQEAADRCGLCPRQRGQAPRQGRQGHQPPARPGRTRSPSTRRTPSSSSSGSASSESRSTRP